MANKKISELQSRTPALSDLMLVGDPSSGYSYKCTVTALATIIETDIADGYVTIGTTQTISGAKTFSNNLTLTSVVNTPTDPDKFLTLNASNVVTYRTGSQVLSDIGAADDTLVVHKAGTETITGFKTFQSRLSIDGSLNLLQGAGINTDAGYSNINASSTGFFLTRATGVHAFLNLANLTTGRNFTFPDVTGTIALTSDITDALAGYVPTSRTLTINGVTQSLAANRTFNVGTVETVNFATGTTGTDVNVSGSPITTTGTITLNIPTASATNRGALSSTDWSTFNNKQNALTLTTTGTSGAATLVGATLNIPQYQSVLTNPVTGTGTTNYIPKFTSSSAIGNSQVFDNGTNVGINNASPTYKLDVTGTGRFTGQVNLDNDLLLTQSAYIYSNAGGSGVRAGFFLDGTNTVVTFLTGGSERMRLTSGGSLGIGTTSPAVKLDVNGGLNLASGYDLTWGGAYGANIPTITALSGASANISFYPAGSTSGEKMRITGAGSVGIGTTTPAVKLDVIGNVRSSNSGATVYTEIQNDGLYATGTDLYLLAPSTKFMSFYSGGSERMRLDASGNLGLGTSSPATKLQVIGQSLFTGTNPVLIQRGAGQIGFLLNSPSDNALAFNDWNGTTKMLLDASGNLGLGVTPSAWSGYRGLQIDAQASLSSTGGVFNIGTNVFYGASGYTYIANGEATLYQQASGVHNWRTAPSGTAGNTISFTQAMTLDASGSLLISRTSSANSVFKLQVGDGSGDTRVRFNSSNAYSVGILRGTGNPYYIGATDESSPSLVFSNTAGTERMRITDAGNVGIGTTSPTQTFDVRGTGVFGNGTSSYYVDASADATNAFVRASGTTDGMFVGTRNATAFRIFTNDSEKMRITSGGDVGIGTSSPTQKLTIQKSGYPIIDFYDGATGRGDIGYNAGTTSFNISSYSTIPLAFYTNSSERMRITSGGELLINTTSDAGDYKLQVNGNGYFSGNAAAVQSVEITNASASGFSGLILANTGTSGRTYTLGLGGNTSGQNGNFYIYDNTASATRFLINSSGNAEFSGSIKTAAPSGGTAKPIKFGEIVTLGGSNTQGVRVEIDGTVYYLVTGYLP